MKMTEVGWIPKDWEVSIVGNECDVKTGPFGSALHADDYVIKGTPIITVEHIGNIHIDRSKQIPQVSEEDKQRLKAYILKEGDIVFSRVGSIDRNSLVFKEEDGWLFSGRLLRMRKLPKAKFDPLYLCYHLNTYDSRNRILAEAVGQTMPSLNTKILNGISIVLPQSISEQRRIAEVLSDTDSLIASLSRTIEKKRLVKQGAMQQLLTGKTRLKGFSGEWVEKEFREIYKSAREGGTPDTSKEEYYANGNIYFVKIDDMKNKYVVKAESKISEEGLRHSSAWMIPRRSILFSNGATIGRVCITNVDLCTKQGILGIVPKEEFNVEYLYYLLSSDEFMREVTSRITIGTMPIVYLNKLNEIKLYLPEDPNEQFAISERLRTMDNEIASLEAELQKYKALKQGMMQKLLTGQIRLV